ncbi:MAG TPA: M14 metallopeptidase family protein [Gemmatimonadota bacterium]|nr:M14 metallopeptidase family protein [Gemmatimonadota bacterium]
MTKRIGTLIAIALCTALAGPGRAAAQTPSFAEITGHAFGERVTVHQEAVRYLEALAATSDRVRIVEQGASWEGRKLLVAIVTAPENHARLDEIRAAAQRLGDPRATSPSEAARLMESQPVIIWYGGSIHGFELSGSEGVLKLLEHLTTRDDEATLEVLRNAVILIDPMLNPDGRDAFANLNHERVGRVPNPKREDWANDFDRWQGLKFRTGHYYFDTNRDWFAHTQRETRARMPTILAWRPQVVIDMHEMGSDTEFFFDPGQDPYAPYFPEHSKRWFDIFGRAYAAAFDSAGFEYMTREAFDYFYPGYTTSMGDFQNAVGMLYEQGSSRGLALERPDDSVRTLADALEQQYVAAWTAARTAVARRDALLSEYYESIRVHIADGGQGIRRYLIAQEGDPLHVAELVNMLMRNGIEVNVLTRPVRLSDVRDRAGAGLGTREFPSGTYVIDAAQPHNRLIRMLLEPEVPTPEKFLSEARARIERGASPQFYDITAWSLPLLFNVGGYSSGDGRDLAAERVAAPVEVAASLPVTRPGYAYLIDGKQTASVAALYHLKIRGYRASFLDRATRIAGRQYSGGTIIVRLGQNDDTVHDAMREIAERYGLDIGGTDTGFSEPGFPTLGSGDHTFMVREPVIAMVAESPIFGYSFGWAWYTLDQQYQIPVTVVRAGSLAESLHRFNVLVIPSTSGALAGEIGDDGVERLKTWVRDGGTLITIGGATEFARSQLDLISLRSWYDLEENEDAVRFGVPGAIFNTSINEHQWLGAGYDAGQLPALVNSSSIYLMPEGPPSSRYRAVATYGTLLSGHAWTESLERLPDAVYVYEERVGAGRVIAFTEDLNYRAFCRGANRLFLNAVVVGPSAP